MKMSKIALSVAAASMTLTAHAGTISGGALAGLGTNEADGAGLGSVPVAVIVPGDVHNALQAMQDFPAACIGNRNKLCSPTMSSAEVRAIVNGALASSSSISSPNGTLLANFGDLTNFTGVAATGAPLLRVYSPNVVDGITQFAGGGSIDGKSCGAGSVIAAASVATADDATTLSTVGAGFKKARIGFIHATELDDSNQDVGFVKVDGAAPDLVNLLSGNYNIVSNVHGAASLTATEKATNGTTVGASSAAPYHNFLGAYVACAGLDVQAAASDVNGGGI